MPTIYEGKYGLGGALKEAGDFAAAVSKAQKEAAAMAMQNAQMAADIALARQRVDEMRLRRLHQQTQDEIMARERAADNARADEAQKIAAGHLRLAQENLDIKKQEAEQAKRDERSEQYAFLTDAARRIKPTENGKLAMETIHELAKSGNMDAARKRLEAALEDQEVEEVGQVFDLAGTQFANLNKGVQEGAVFDEADKAKAQELEETYGKLRQMIASNPNTPAKVLRESAEVIKKQLTSAVEEFRAKYQSEVNRERALQFIDSERQKYGDSPETMGMLDTFYQSVDMRLIDPKEAVERLAKFKEDVAAAANRASGREQSPDNASDVRNNVLLRGAQAPGWLEAEAKLEVRRVAGDDLMAQAQEGDQKAIARLNELMVNAYKRKGLPTLPAPPELMQARAAKSAEAIEATLAAMEQQMGRVLQDWEVEILLGGGEIVP